MTPRETLSLRRVPGRPCRAVQAPASHSTSILEDLTMEERTMALRKRSGFTAVAAENSALRVKCDAMYTLLERCRDWLKIMGADPKKVSEVEGGLRAVRRTLL